MLDNVSFVAAVVIQNGNTANLKHVQTYSHLIYDQIWTYNGG